MSDQNFSAIRARLRYETIEDFVDGYARFISAGGMFIPMKPGKLKPIGTTIRFQFLLGDGSTALLGEGIVLQVRAPDDASPQSPVGMLIKFSKLAQESKALVDRIVEEKSGGSPAPEEHRDDIHNDRTPLPQDKESYERKTRESFENRSLNQLLASEPDDTTADAHSKRTDAGAESSDWREITREQPVVKDSEQADEAGTPVNDSFGSEEEANDALVAAALAMAGEVSSDAALEEPSEDSDDDDSVSLEEIDPETAEAPDVAEPETREAPEMLPEAIPKSPTQLGETTGGLKILAFEEDMDELALKALEEFSFGAEEADIDDMFDGLFGDGGGGFFGGESDPEPQPSMEFEVPGLTQEVSDELVEEEISVAEEDEQSSAEEEPVEEKPVFSLEDLMDDEEEEEEESEPALVLEESSPEEEPVEEKPVFSLEDLMDDEDESETYEPSPVVVEEESEVHEELFDEDSAPEISLSEAFESEPELLLESPSESEHEFDVPDGLSLDSSAASEASDASSASNHELEDIGSLLDNLDDSSRMSPESMHLGTSLREKSPVSSESEVEDEESLEALLASARREMEERSTEEPRDSGDILDQLLGDDLPPPPAEGPVFGMPQPEKKKKGFLSKFFDKG